MLVCRATTVTDVRIGVWCQMLSGRCRRYFLRGGGGWPAWLLTGRDGSSAGHDIRRRAALILAVAAAAAASMAVLTSASAAPARPAGGAQRLAAGNPWSRAQEVPGTAALNKGPHEARITSVSCASAGNCSAGGFYTTEYNATGSSTQQAFVVSEVHGRWRKAETVPGTAGLDNGHEAEITSVSCASAGNCAAGGYYGSDGSLSGIRAFVVSEVHGRWRKAHTLRQGDGALINSVSCASAGNCSAGGSYGVEDSGNAEAFTVSEVHGRWQKAEIVPGSFRYNDGGDARITSVSCASAGNCIAGGYFTTVSRGDTYRQEAIVVNQVHGTWQNLEEVPGTAAVNIGENAQTTSVSCSSAGNCSAGGSDGSPSGIQAFVVSEVHGSWRTAEVVPGTAALDKGGSAQITSVSCASAGNCSAGGSYTTAYNAAGSTQQAFVVTEVHGRWRTAEEVPATAALNKAGIAQITSVSCASAGNCSAGGSYAGGYYPKGGYFPNGRQKIQAFVVSEVHGRWQRAEEVPGTAALSNRRGAQITSVSCGSAGHCSAGGSYAVSKHGSTQAFVVSRK